MYVCMCVYTYIYMCRRVIFCTSLLAFGELQLYHLFWKFLFYSSHKQMKSLKLYHRRVSFCTTFWVTFCPLKVVQFLTFEVVQVWGQVRWALGPPHLTLKPSHKFNKTKQQKNKTNPKETSNETKETKTWNDNQNMKTWFIKQQQEEANEKPKEEKSKKLKAKRRKGRLTNQEYKPQKPAENRLSGTSAKMKDRSDLP